MRSRFTIYRDIDSKLMRRCHRSRLLLRMLRVMERSLLGRVAVALRHGSRMTHAWCSLHAGLRGTTSTSTPLPKFIQKGYNHAMVGSLGSAIATPSQS